MNAVRATARAARQGGRAGCGLAPGAAGREREALRRPDSAEDGSCVVVLDGPRRCLEHAASVRVGQRPASLRVFVLFQLSLLPLAEQLRRIQVREFVNLVRMLDAEEQQVRVGTVVVRGHLDPSGPSRPARVNVRHAAVEREVAGVVVLLVQRAGALWSRAAERPRVQALNSRRRRLGMCARCHPAIVLDGAAARRLVRAAMAPATTAGEGNRATRSAPRHPRMAIAPPRSPGSPQ